MAGSSFKRFYGLVLAVVACLCAAFVLTFVAPRLEPIYADFDTPMPGLTVYVYQMRSLLAGVFTFFALLLIAKECVLMKHRQLAVWLNLIALAIAVTGTAIVFFSVLAPIAKLYEPIS